MNEVLYKFKNLNWFYFLLVCFLSFIGVVMIYSATSAMEIEIFRNHLIKVIFGIFVMLIISIIDIEFWKRNAFYIYFFFLITLVWASFFGYIGKGSRRWIELYGFYLQPSEFMKIFIILSLAKFFDEKQIKEKRDYFFLILPILIVLIPVGIILEQPDLGTSLIILIISFLIFFIAGLSWKFFASIGFVSLVLTPYLWSFLKAYQKQRILTLFNPESDPLGSGYHIIQSQIAIGSGGMLGKGWMKGTQSHLDFLPEKHTDFIFSMLGEEFGFLGTISVIGLLVLITFSTYGILNSLNRDLFKKIIGYGIISNFFFASMINMSMVIGILPVVGLPLPLVSYGGSSMLSYFIGFGLILSLDMSSKKNY